MVDSRWPFRDPKSLATFTQRKVMSGERPVTYVRRDLQDGLWQFLADDELSVDEVMAVCLKDVVATDPSLRQVADLRLGWFAERESPASPWVKDSDHPTDWNELMEDAQLYTEQCQDRLRSEFSIEEWKRYDYDQHDAQIVFSTNGAPRFQAKIQVVGSTSTKSDTWLWSWGNRHILDGAKESMHLLPRFGEEHGFERLATAGWSGDECDGWEMSCLACLLLEADGVYRVPHDDGAVFLLLRDPVLLVRDPNRNLN